MPLHLDGTPTMAEALAAADRSDGLYEGQILQAIADDPYPPGVAFGLFVNLVYLTDGEA